MFLPPHAQAAHAAQQQASNQSKTTNSTYSKQDFPALPGGANHSSNQNSSNNSNNSGPLSHSNHNNSSSHAGLHPSGHSAAADQSSSSHVHQQQQQHGAKNGRPLSRDAGRSNGAGTTTPTAAAPSVNGTAVPPGVTQGGQPSSLGAAASSSSIPSSSSSLLGSASAGPAALGAAHLPQPHGATSMNALAAAAQRAASPFARSYHSVPSTPSIQPPSADEAAAAAALKTDKFGLMGLLNVIKMTNMDLNTLALGSDLTTLGLNLNATEPLYTSFTSPWAETPDVFKTPIPACYQVSTAPPALEKKSTFADETLFYIFYSMPNDEMQMHAAIELYNRNWRYHRELHLWLTKDPGTPLIVKAPSYERGTYVFWDVNAWARVAKEFLLVYAMLEDAPRYLAAAEPSAVSSATSFAPSTHTPSAEHAQQQQQQQQIHLSSDQSQAQPQQPPPPSSTSTTVAPTSGNKATAAHNTAAAHHSTTGKGKIQN